MKKILTIVGARPQFIKAAAVSRTISEHYSDRITEHIVHTGQHYDANMSKVFFDELGIPEPFKDLGIGSGGHGSQTGSMLSSLEEVLQEVAPDAVMVYGDTNSTLAGSLAASKLHIPVVHVEAGLRSFNKSMPEEINRVLSDHVSTLLFTPTKAGVENLKAEGFELEHKGEPTIDRPSVYHCGDVMFDNALYFSKIAEDRSSIIEDQGLQKDGFILSTIHRPANTDDPVVLEGLMKGVLKVAEKAAQPVVLPLHPRTRSLMEERMDADVLQRIHSEERLRMIEPVAFLDMVQLEKYASLIMTDSGGVQKEAFFQKKPCIVLRNETEWTELLDVGAAITVGADPARIEEAYDGFQKNPPKEFPPIFGDGKAGKFICERILAL